MRPYLLHLALLVRTVGLVPHVAIAIWCLVASLQEPAFLRSSGLGLLWPSFSAAADICALAACFLWSEAVGLRHFGWPASLKIPGASALVLLSMAFALEGGVVSCCLDLLFGRTVPWSRVVAQLLHTASVWTPMAALTLALAGNGVGTAWRLLVLLLAFLMQAGIHGVSLRESTMGVDKVLATALAVLGSVALASCGGRPARTI